LPANINIDHSEMTNSDEQSSLKQCRLNDDCGKAPVLNKNVLLSELYILSYWLIAILNEDEMMENLIDVWFML